MPDQFSCVLGLHISGYGFEGFDSMQQAAGYCIRNV